MAYCVHCGVKMGQAEPHCPLCGTEAVDPAAAKADEGERSYPVRAPEQTLKINRAYSISVLSVLLLVPAGVCLLFDWLADGITWSIYPAGILSLSWIAVTTPFLVKRHRLYRTVLITAATLAGYLYLVEQVTGTRGWFFPIVFPALAIGVTLGCLTIAMRRKWKMRWMWITAAALVCVGALAVVIELLIVQQAGGGAIAWSQFVLAPCLFLALLLYLISKNRPLYDELKRRLHF